METIVIITNVKQYLYHRTISDAIKTFLNQLGHTTSVIDTDTAQQSYENLEQIKSFNPTVLITLDVSGFHFRTQTGEIALNLLPTKNLNLIWGNKPEYNTYLKKKLSLSMLFYDMSGIDYNLPSFYPYMLYYFVSKKLPVNLIEAATSEDAQNSFGKIWTHFTEQVLLPEE